MQRDGYMSHFCPINLYEIVHFKINIGARFSHFSTEMRRASVDCGSSSSSYLFYFFYLFIFCSELPPNSHFEGIIDELWTSADHYKGLTRLA